MAQNKLVELSFEFAKFIVNLTDNIDTPKSSYMVNQLARAGTSVGANIHEAQYAQGTKDFISKIEIALKECNETEYWLELIGDTTPEFQNECLRLRKDCIELRRMMVAAVTTLKKT